MRTVAWFSCGAASAVATKLINPDVIAYCATGSEDKDNHRFMLDCEEWFKKSITVLKSAKYSDTWEVFEDRQYLAGNAGAPCTKELKVLPRLAFQKPDDIHVFGYTADRTDVTRANALTESYPELTVRYPLIERGINKAACLAMVQAAGIKPPRVYALGYPNANCMPCVKASSPAYWSLCRKTHPEEFERMVKLSRKYGARLARVNGVRVFIDEVPEGFETTQPIAPECDFLCQLAEQEIRK